MSRVLRAKIPPPLDPEALPAPARREVLALRQHEGRIDRASTAEQYRANHIFALYGRKIDIDHGMRPGEWKVLEPVTPKFVFAAAPPLLGGGIWRRGRDGVLPSRQTLQAKHWLAISLAPDVADFVIERDKGS